MVAWYCRIIESGADPIVELPLLIADLFEAAGAMRRRGDQIAAVAGQTQARWQVLSVLSDGHWTVPQVARRLGVSRQAVQRIVDELRNDGLVGLKPNPDHERSEPGTAHCSSITCALMVAGRSADDRVRGDAGAVASSPFGVVERLIGAAKQCLGIVRVLV